MGSGSGRQVEYFYSIRSSFTYLGGARLLDIAARHGARITHKPFDLSAAVRAAGGKPFPEAAPPRRVYHEVEVIRWGRYLGIPVLPDPEHHFGPRELPSGMVIAAQRMGLDCGPLSNAILAALWRDDRDIADAAVLKSIADDLGLDGADLVARAARPGIEAELAANTGEAIARGVFGSPTYIVDGEMFWGQDRLDFVDRALAS